MQTANIKICKFNLDHFNDYVDNGKYLNWFENGQKFLERRYQNGKLHGKSIRFYETGQEKWESEYQNGKLENITKI